MPRPPPAGALATRAAQHGFFPPSVASTCHAEHNWLRAYGVTADPVKAKTGYDVIKHLIGSCKGGSSDLATNPRHLDGYGR